MNPTVAGTASDASDFLRLVISHGNFPSGIVLGMVFAGVTHWASGRASTKERIRKAELDAEREKELLKQLGLKDDRLVELHKELGKLRNPKK